MFSEKKICVFFSEYQATLDFMVPPIFTRATRAGLPLGCQASKTAFRSHCARTARALRDATYAVRAIYAPCPNVQPRAHSPNQVLTHAARGAREGPWSGQRAHARLTGLTSRLAVAGLRGSSLRCRFTTYCRLITY